MPEIDVGIKFHINYPFCFPYCIVWEDRSHCESPEDWEAVQSVKTEKQMVEMSEHCISYDVC